MSTVMEKLAAMESRYEKIAEELSKPEVINNQSEFQKLAKAHAEMTTIIETYRRYKKLDEELAEARELLKEGLEPDFRAMVEEERKSLEQQREALEGELKSSCCRRIPTTRRTSSSRSAPAPAATRRLCSPPTCSGCTAATPSGSRWRIELISSHRRRSWAASKK